MEYADRFWAKVAKSDGCWEWTAALRNGYGVISAGGHSGPALYAHRASWVLHFGPIPSGMHVLHHCDNPRCVRPGHLFLGTQRDNLVDMREKGRGRVPTARSGSAHHWFGRDDRGERNPHARLTEDDVRAIRSSGDGPTELSRRYGVSRAHIYAIRCGRAWAHVDAHR